MKLMHPKKKLVPPAPPPPPEPVDEGPDATPAEVLQELREELAAMKDHTGNNHVEKLVVIVDRLLETMQEGPPADDDVSRPFADDSVSDE